MRASANQRVIGWESASERERERAGDRRSRFDRPPEITICRALMATLAALLSGGASSTWQRANGDRLRPPRLVGRSHRCCAPACSRLHSIGPSWRACLSAPADNLFAPGCRRRLGSCELVGVVGPRGEEKSAQAAADGGRKLSLTCAPAASNLFALAFVPARPPSGCLAVRPPVCMSRPAGQPVRPSCSRPCAAVSLSPESL